MFRCERREYLWVSSSKEIVCCQLQTPCFRDNKNTKKLMQNTRKCCLLHANNVRFSNCRDWHRISKSRCMQYFYAPNKKKHPIIPRYLPENLVVRLFYMRAWLFYTSDMTSFLSFLCVYDSFIRQTWLHFCHSYEIHESFQQTCVTWILNMCDMTYLTLLIHQQDTFIYITWIVRLSDGNHFLFNWIDHQYHVFHSSTCVRTVKSYDLAGHVK